MKKGEIKNKINRPRYASTRMYLYVVDVRYKFNANNIALYVRNTPMQHHQ